MNNIGIRHIESTFFGVRIDTILNVHDALNEFGVMEISLHPQVMAQTGTTSGTTTNMGKQLETDVKCTKVLFQSI